MSTEGGRIPERFIQTVVAKTDLVALIKEHVPLKKAGTNYTACCPFHNEKTPSFSVSPAKQFYHCFGCQAHGDAIGFLMAYQSLPFIEALEKLALRVGLELPKTSASRAQGTEGMKAQYLVLLQVAEYYHAQFKKHPAANKAIVYLKNRGMLRQGVKQFSLGFAPPGWNHLYAHFQAEPSAIKVLEETGLIIRHAQGRYYDRFRNRIMFPIRDRRGNVIAFGGRALEEEHPKYLNSPESPVFQKGQCLYGLYETLQMKKNWRTAIIVEGYFDVVMLAQHGVAGALATLGTAMNVAHLTLLFQHVSEVIFCFDGDTPGQAAAWKALQLVLPFLQQGRQVQFAFLPKGEDPDSYLRAFGVDAFQALLNNSLPLSEYFFTNLLERCKPNSLDAKAQFVHLAKPLLEQIPQGVFKEMMFEQLSNLVQSSRDVVRGGRQGGERPFTRPTRPSFSPPPGPLTPAFVVSAFLLDHPEYFALVKAQRTWLETVVMPGMDLLRCIFAFFDNTPSPEAQQLFTYLKARRLLYKNLLLCQEKIRCISNQEGQEAEFLGAVKKLLAVGREQSVERLLQKAKEGALSDEEKHQLKEILQSRESI